MNTALSAPDSDMPSAALEVVKAAKKLYGGRVARVVEEVFQSRGILP